MRLLGQGREAEVFARPDGSVLKLLREAGQSPDREMAALAAVSGCDGLVPAALGRITVSGRSGIVLERVDGPDLLSLVGSRPWLLRQAGRVMAEVHSRLHVVAAPTTLPDLRTELAHRVRYVTGLPEDLASWALSILDELPDGDRLCHGDLHLGNILGGLDCPVVIDWGEAARGDPVADVANTWLLHRMGQPPPGTPLHMRAAIPVARGVVVSQYLNTYRRQSPFDPDLYRRWQIVRVAARFYAGIAQEADSLTSWLRARGPDSSKRK
jgi:aminoglycoside phosphotransferase (APT) family kinase protein